MWSERRYNVEQTEPFATLSSSMREEEADLKTNVETCSINERNERKILRVIGAAFHPECPHESELLAFYERALSSWNKTRIEKHLGECQFCRESIAMMVSLDRATKRDPGEDDGAVGEDVIRAQVGRIVERAGIDEVRRGEVGKTSRFGRLIPGQSKSRLSLPLSNRLMLATAALLLVLLAAPVVFWMLSRPSESLQAMQALEMAVVPGRNAEAVISGLRYSPHVSLRGGSDRDDLMFDRALSKVSFAEDTTAPIEARHTLAKILLARNAGTDPEKALKILKEIAPRKPGSPEIQNDIGVAQFELSLFPDAISSFNRALEASPGFREALFNRAVAEKANMQNSDAVRSFEEFLRTNPDAEWRAEAELNVRQLKNLLTNSN